MDYTRSITATNGTPAARGLSAFDQAEAAPAFTTIPPGFYVARVVRGGLTRTKAGDDAYRVRLEIVEGEQKGKTVFRVFTFSEKAIGYSKRDLSVFGLTTSAGLLGPFPPAGREFIVRITVALQRGNDEREFNDVKKIELIRIVESPAARYMLPTQGEGGQQ